VARAVAPLTLGAQCHGNKAEGNLVEQIHRFRNKRASFRPEDEEQM